MRQVDKVRKGKKDDKVGDKLMGGSLCRDLRREEKGCMRK